MILLKTAAQIDGIRKSCKIVAIVLNELKHLIAPGISTAELNKAAEDICYQHNAIPAFKGYRGFPYSICASKNKEIVHGFPNKIPLKSGDIISIDFGVIYKGWYGDAAFTKCVGVAGNKKIKLINITKQCLDKAINKAWPGNRIGDIGFVIQSHAENNGFNVIKDFVGHGIGRDLHEDPQIKNYGARGEGKILKVGMTIAIEPMIVQGTSETLTMNNKWTVVSKDGGLSAHFEHSIVITKEGPEILTI